MSETSKIQWCDSTVNPTMGCDGCELWNDKTGVRICYAGQLHERYGGCSSGYSPTFNQLTRHPGRMAKAARLSDLSGTRRMGSSWLDGLPRMIFVSDMSDALSSEVPFMYLQREIVEVVNSQAGRRHRWLWLTKRPRRMGAFHRWLQKRGIQWPANLWAGTSVTSQKTIHRLGELESVGDERTIRFVSLEPQWGPVDLALHAHAGIHWVVQGGQSGGNAVPFGLNQARDVRDQCHRAGVAYFLKQVGAFPVEHVNVDGDGERVERNDLVLFVRGKNKRDLGIRDAHGGDWDEWPADMRVREFPAVRSIQ